MKLLVASIAVVFSIIPGASPDLTPGPARIQVTGALAAQHGPTRIYNLYNRPAYTDRIGQGFLTCYPAGPRWRECAMSLRLERGQVVSRAVVAAASSFRQFAVTGGTGLYANVGGQMTVQPLGDGVVLILVDLTAF